MIRVFLDCDSAAVNKSFLSTLIAWKIKATSFSETSGTTYTAQKCYIPEDRKRRLQECLDFVTR